MAWEAGGRSVPGEPEKRCPRRLGVGPGDQRLFPGEPRRRVTGWQNQGEAQNVTVELLRRGYSEKDIAKLWGGNFLRVWGQAQKAAKNQKS